MFLQDYIDEVKLENPLWKSKSRIIGRAGEIFCCNCMKCIKCDSSNWLECITNEKSKDQICIKCNKKYQIKCKNITEKQYNNIMSSKIFKTIGAEYNTTLKSVEEKIDYIIILYDKKYKILDILHINSDNINCNNIIPRKKLGPNARRAGWKGCYLNFTDFNCIKSSFNTLGDK